ncbi:MAG TPA: nucleotide exchange factor GrpE [Thermoplasmata archaeon]|nr:nucleotide exchange factor GrpE [Thermoplasmata archaeon]
MPDEAPEEAVVAEEKPGSPPVGATKATEPDWETRFKYLLADFENFRKRGDRDRELARQRAEGRLLQAILPIFETTQEASTAAEKFLGRRDPIRRGLEMLQSDWNSFLEGEGIEPLARPGLPFRPEEHEAVGEAPATSERPDGTIAEVVQQGYRSRAGLLRPAKVIVARKAKTPPPPSGLGEAPKGAPRAATEEGPK